eukprot:6480887-Amphidinium_carterae.3
MLLVLLAAQTLSGLAQLTAETRQGACALLGGESEPRRRKAGPRAIIDGDLMPRAYNRVFVLILEAQLRVLEFRLEDFASEMPRVLQPGTVRTVAAVTEMRFDAQRWSRRLMWHIVADQGPKNWPALTWL